MKRPVVLKKKLRYDVFTIQTLAAIDLENKLISFKT